MLDAADSAEALRALSANDAKADLSLIDVVLPGAMNGRELARRLAELYPGLRILFMSGYTENAIVHHGRLDDGVVLLGKPFSREQLAQRIADLLRPLRVGSNTPATQSASRMDFSGIM